eukprot:TRINITY_DN31971_c0_g1_i1.p1 TRINITY_DN31971_c0_g1~~TRINITY_DN31971_c0_g1_i1.p1  ORF type:complete len:908 (+),score=313.18 TRINITY_DN31971_c0_g1_i1:62-2785(+)
MSAAEPAADAAEPALLRVKQQPADDAKDVKVKLEVVDPLPGPAQPWRPPESLLERRPVIRQCFQRVAQSVWDIDSWTVILKEVRGHPLPQVEAVYERALHYYPTATWVWVDYLRLIQEEPAERMSAAEKSDRVHAVFKALLPRVFTVSVWREYMTTVMERGDPKEVDRAFKLACTRLGTDWEADVLYRDYLGWLRQQPGSSTYQHSSVLREAYKELVTTPVRNLEDYVRQYELFERQMNPKRPPRFSDEQKSHIDRAKCHFIDLQPYVNGIDMEQLSRPPEMAAPAVGGSTPADWVQIAMWLRLVEFERRNPMYLHDAGAVVRRVSFTVNKALMFAYRYSGLWHSLAMLQFDSGKVNEAHQTFSLALEACPDDLCLRLAYTDFLASLAPDAAIPTAVADRDQSGSAVVLPWQRPGQSVPSEAGEVNDEEKRRRHVSLRPFPLGVAVCEDAVLLSDGDSSRRTVAWAHYLRFLKSAARTTEEIEQYGAALERAHTDPLCSGGEIYIVASRLERSVTPDARQRQILEMGYGRLREAGSLAPAFVLRYVDSLSECGDAGSLRALFETLFGSGEGGEPSWAAGHPSSSLVECFNRCVDFHVWHSDLSKVRSAERQRRSRVGERQVGLDARELVHRYTVLGLLPVTAPQLAAINGVEREYWKLAAASEDEAARRPQFTQQRPLTERGLEGHSNPRMTRYLPVDTTAQWVPIGSVVPANPCKWTDQDEQTAEGTKPPVALSRWDPSKAPEIVEGLLGQASVTGEGGVAAAAPGRRLPSVVQRLVEALPPPTTFAGKPPSAGHIMKMFTSFELPKLSSGRIGEDQLNRARAVLSKHNFSDVHLLEDEYVPKVRREIERLRRDRDDLVSMRRGCELQLALAQLLTQLKCELARKRERDKAREERQLRAAKEPRWR